MNSTISHELGWLVAGGILLAVAEWTWRKSRRLLSLAWIVGRAMWAAKRGQLPTLGDVSEAQLRREIAERALKLRDLHQGAADAPRILVRDLHTGAEVGVLAGTPCFFLHHGEPQETARPVTGPHVGFFPALVGDLVRDPGARHVPPEECEAGRAFAEGEPLRYWSPATGGTPIEVDVRELHLFEVVPPPQPPVTA